MNEKLHKLLSEEPLVHDEPSEERMNLEQITRKLRGSMYYGTGLTTKTEMSVGMPFDILIMVLVAELLRRELKLDYVYHHIADTHALTNPHTTGSKVDDLAIEYEKVIKSIANILKMPLKVKRSSEFDTSATYEDILKKVETDKHEYVKRELADILWYRSRYNLRLKLGWLIQARAKKGGFDERMFDDEFLKQCDERMSFAYTASGKTLDSKRPNVPPYISILKENRVLIRDDENVKARFDKSESEKMNKNMEKHLALILGLWDKLSPIKVAEGGDVIERTQALIELIRSGIDKQNT